MQTKPLAKMSPVDLCVEAESIRKGIETAVTRLNEVYAALYSKARQSSTLYPYLSVANSGRRFSGMILQASRRASGLERRVLAQSRQGAEERDQKASEKQAEGKKEKSSGTHLDPLERLLGIPVEPQVVLDEGFEIEDSSADLDDLYGQESS